MGLNYAARAILGLSCFSFFCVAAQLPENLSSKKIPKQINPSERRKLIKQVHETMRDPQDKELETIAIESNPQLPAVPSHKPAPVLISRSRRQLTSSVLVDRSPLILNWFNIGIGTLSDSEGGSAFTTVINWIPSYILNPDFRLKAQFGILGGNLFTDGAFGGGDASLSMVYSGLGKMLFELGGGCQYWDGRGGWLPQIRTSIGYRLPWGEEYVHAINLSYSRLFTSLLSLHVTTVSVSFRF